MASKSSKTGMVSREEALEKRDWKLIDADGAVLGRLATRVASVLRGKHKPTFAPHVDAGDFVVVVNASKIRLTGKKAEDKIYYRHTNHPGGIRSTTAGDRLDNDPAQLVRDVVAGMLPKNRLSRRLIQKLKVYPGAEHPHAAQGPVPLTLD